MGKWSKYSKLYNKEWEKDGKLKSWIRPVPGDQAKTLCTYCRREIRCHRNDLVKHSETKKHLKNAAIYFNSRNRLENQDDSIKPIVGGRELETDELVLASSIPSANNLEVPERSWLKYSKLYNKEWGKDIMLKSWIRPVHGDQTRAFCKYCKCEIGCQRNHLVCHSETKKHKKNAAHYSNAMNRTLLDNHDVKSIIRIENGEKKCNEHSARQSIMATLHQINDTFIEAAGKKRPTSNIQYNREWEKDDMLKSWIRPVHGDRTNAFCKYCKCEIRCNRNDLVGHSETKNHKKNAESYTNSRNIDLYNVSAKLIVRDNMVKIAELKLAAYVACHSTMEAADHLGEVVGAVARKDITLNRNKCAALIKRVLFPSMREELLADLKDVAYSLIIDESMDACLQKKLCVVIRYFSRSYNQILSTFLGIVSIPFESADEIWNAIQSFMQKNDLGLSKCIGLAMDGGNVMLDKKKSVVAKLKEACPNTMLFKCVSHSLRLCSLHALKALPRIEFFLSQTHNWFVHSRVNQARFNDLHTTIIAGQEPPKIPTALGTPELSLSCCVSGILSQYEEFKLYFQMAIDGESSYTAELLYEMFSDVKNQLYLVFLQPFLQEIDRVDQFFQMENLAPFELLKGLVLLYQTILGRVMLPITLDSWGTTMNYDVEDKSNHLPLNDIFFGNKFQLLIDELKIEAAITEKVKERCQNYMFELLKQIRARLPENVQQFESLADLAPSVVLGNKRPPLRELSFLCLYQGQTEVLEQQWDRLESIQWPQAANDDGVGRFWIDVAHHKDSEGKSDFSELGNFALSLLSLPFCNATVERIFSQVQQGTDEAVMYVRSYVGRKTLCCYTFVPTAGMIDRCTPHIYGRIEEEEDL